MKSNPDERAAHILLARALKVDPRTITPADLSDFRDETPLSEYEQSVVDVAGDAARIAHRIVASETRSGAVQRREAEFLVGSFNRGNLGNDWPDDLRRMLEEKRRQLLDESEDKDDADGVADPEARD